MNFQGNNYLSIAYLSGLSFNLGISLNNLTGVCNLGFDFLSSPFNFKFNQGKILDPEKRLVYFYKENKQLIYLEIYQIQVIHIILIII